MPRACHLKSSMALVTTKPLRCRSPGDVLSHHITSAGRRRGSRAEHAVPRRRGTRAQRTCGCLLASRGCRLGSADASQTPGGGGVRPLCACWPFRRQAGDGSHGGSGALPCGISRCGGHFGNCSTRAQRLRPYLSAHVKRLVPIHPCSVQVHVGTGRLSGFRV
jgi:hypothetical protein